VAKRHLTRKEIKQPDQFVSYSVWVMEWTRSHRNYLLYGVLGIIIIVGLLVAWSFWQQQRRQEADILLYEAVKMLNPDGTHETSTSGQVLTQFRRITTEYSSTPASAFAHWYLGHLYYDQGDFTAALAAYQQAQRRFSRHRDLFMLGIITLNIGYTQEASGLCDAAVGNFEQVVQSSANWLHGEAFLGTGRCYEKQGALAEAKATYDRALSNNTVDTTVLQKIEEQRARLGTIQDQVK
jgi:predicted negative regulator of RcsB-dependent stress response